MRLFKIDDNYALKAQKGRGKILKQIEAEWALEVLTPKSVVGLLSIWVTLWKMKARNPFHISRKPVVPLAEGQKSHNLANGLELPRFYGPPRLLALARDPWTIFAYWNVDWPSIFKNALPIDRQVHLRIHCAGGLEEKEAAVEPMVGMHYVTMSQSHRTCRIELGYYQPADVWHSVATSNEIVIPPGEISESEDVDLATIPFHLRFQQLVDLFGANDDALATVISRFQTRVVSKVRSGTLTSEQRKILRRTSVTPSEVTGARRAFNRSNSEKLKKRSEGLLGLGVTSPSRGFRSDWTSGGS
jgi:hypothetical protein